MISNSNGKFQQLNENGTTVLLSLHAANGDQALQKQFGSMPYAEYWKNGVYYQIRVYQPLTANDLLRAIDTLRPQAKVAAPLASDPSGFNLGDCTLYPKATLVFGNESAIPGSPSLLSQTLQGSAVGPPFDSKGLPTTHLDNGDIRLSLLQSSGVTSARVIAATVTNSGNKVLNLTDFRIFGMLRGPPGYEWVSVLQAGAVDLRPNPTMDGKCTWSEPPARIAQALSPGQSLTTYITGAWSSQGYPINGFHAQVIYGLPGDPLGYSIDTDISWIK
jgi:hypothetical protein